MVILQLMLSIAFVLKIMNVKWRSQSSLLDVKVAEDIIILVSYKNKIVRTISVVEHSEIRKFYW